MVLILSLLCALCAATAIVLACTNAKILRECRTVLAQNRTMVRIVSLLFQSNERMYGELSAEREERKRQKVET